MSQLPEELLEEAKLFCARITLKWPESKGILWFKMTEIDDMGDKWRVASTPREMVRNGMKDSMWSQIRSFLSLQQKLLQIGSSNYNMSNSVPHPPRYGLTKGLQWPGKPSQVRNICITTDVLKDATKTVVDVLKGMWRGDAIALYGFPIDHIFAHEILYIIGHFFDEVGLVSPRGSCSTFLFYGFRKLNIHCERMLQSIHTALRSYDPENLSITFIFVFESEFFQNTCLMHCLCLKHRVLEILNTIEEAKNNVMCSGRLSREFIETHKEQNSYKLQRECLCSECLSLGAQGSLASCAKLKDELQHLSQFVLGLSLDCPEDNSILLDLSREELPSLQIQNYAQKGSAAKESEDIKFCAVQLYHYQRRLHKIYSTYFQDRDMKESSITTIFKKYPWAKNELEVVELDFGKLQWMKIEDHRFIQVETLRRIINALDLTWHNECLELNGLQMLTEFNVSIVYLLGHVFQKVRFYHSNSGNNTVVLINLKNNNKVETVKNHFKKAVSDCLMVQSLVSWESILGHKFCEKVRDSNNMILKKQCQYMLEALLDNDG